jgi:hypothetical protein
MKTSVRLSKKYTEVSQNQTHLKNNTVYEDMENFIFANLC